MKKDTRELMEEISYYLFYPTSLLGLSMFMYGGIIVAHNANDPWQAVFTGAHVIWFGMAAAVSGAAWRMLDTPKNEKEAE